MALYDLDTAEQIIVKGKDAEIDHRSKANGYTALMYAAENGLTDIVGLLVERKANLYKGTKDINIFGRYTSKGLTALHLAAVCAVAVLLVFRLLFHSCLFSFALSQAKDHVDIIKILLEKGHMDLYTTDGCGNTAMVGCHSSVFCCIC
jgi:hypothetical protein